jgi:ribosomal subunit interface protein
MEGRLQITFRDMEPSDAVEARVRERVAKLEQHYGRITSCRVSVEAPHRRHHQGKLYHVTIDLTVPQGEVLVNREPAQRHSHEDVYVAIRDAFNAAERRLDKFGARQRGDVKRHEMPPHARVVRLFSDEGYGFIETVDGREIYFHKNSLLNAEIGELEVGRAVEFVEEQGQDGPQASSVRLLGKAV